MWQLIYAENNYYRIRSVNGMVLDDWGGQIDGKESASQQRDNGDNLNRMWKLVPADKPYFRIVSSNGMVIDDWGASIFG
jgi:hypothetical protein